MPEPASSSVRVHKDLAPLIAKIAKEERRTFSATANVLMLECIETRMAKNRAQLKKGPKLNPR